MSDISTKLDKLLPGLPSEIVRHIGVRFEQLQRHFVAGRHEPSELNGAKFCEAIFRFLEWKCSESYTPFGQHVVNFGQSLKRFENHSGEPDSVRFHIPKALDLLFTLRNKRGVGHLSGDIDANDLDAMLVERIASWILAELVRLLNDINAADARQMVETLAELPIPAVWTAFGKRHVLVSGLQYSEKILILLSTQPDKPIHIDELQRSLRHPAKNDLRKVLVKLDADALIAFDAQTQNALISPTGVRRVDEMNLSSAA